MAKISVVLDFKRPNKNGECNIIIKTSVKSKNLALSTGVSCHPDNWDADKHIIKGTTKNVKDNNLIINSCLARLINTQTKYRLKNKDLTAELLRKEYYNPTADIDFYAFFEQEMKELKKDNEASTMRTHQNALNKLKEYKKELTFSDLDIEFFTGFQRWLSQKKKNNGNTIRKNLKTIKVYVNLALRKKIIENDPFEGLKMKRSDTNIIYLEPEELEKLIKIYKKKLLSANLQKVLRYFLFSCFTGLRISDVKAITREHIIADSLVFHPVKTKSIMKIVRVKLTMPAMELINENKAKQGPIFETFSDPVTNRYLKDVADKCGIKKPLKYHSARHTFATMYYRMTHNIVGLQKLLGHSDIKVTMIYTHIINTDTDKEMELFNKLW
jgi:integrase/recombinase XerD